MKVELIKQRLGVLKSELSKPEGLKNLHIWESRSNFEKHWDLKAIDMATMYNLSFKSQISNSLWFEDNFEPKKVMQAFIDLHPHFVVDMFLDLFNEEKDLMMRINRFIYHCDDLLRMLQKQDQNYYDHFHGDYRMISIYLSFFNPEKYTIYQYDKYCKYLELVGARTKPLNNELPKYFTLMKSLYSNFIRKDDELLQLYENVFLDHKMPVQMNMLACHDLISLTA